MAFVEYDDYDALGLAELVRKGDVSASELLEEAIARAELSHEHISAIAIDMYEHARARVKQGRPEGPFHGVPFLMKDLGTAYAGVPLQASSRLYQGYVPDHHAELTRRYLDAGLVVFAKTTAPELGILPTTEPELYGVTHNPWKRGFTSGGSSGGAAAAVASGVVPMAHGGDGGGSIRIPASCCGLFGLKPTRARTPVGPDESERFFGFAIDHVLTKSVQDSAAALDATHGGETTALYPAPPFDGSFLAATRTPPRKLRIAFTSEPLLPSEGSPDCDRAVRETVSLLRELGHEVEQAHPRFDREAFAKAFFFHFACGVASELVIAESHLGRRARPSDVERTTWLLALVGRSIDAGTFIVHRRHLFDAQREMARFFERYDVLVTSTLGTPPIEHGALLAKGLEAVLQAAVVKLGRPEVMRLPGLIDDAVARAYTFASNTPIFNVTGQPSASVPLHWNDDGLPIGSMLTARFGEDALLLSLCAELERARPWRDRRSPARLAIRAARAA